jgi:hypothetical protein
MAATCEDWSAFPEDCDYLPSGGTRNLTFTSMQPITNLLLSGTTTSNSSMKKINTVVQLSANYFLIYDFLVLFKCVNVV